LTSDIEDPDPEDRSKVPTKSLRFKHTLGRVDGVPQETKHNCADNMIFSDKRGRCVKPGIPSNEKKK